MYVEDARVVWESDHDEKDIEDDHSMHRSAEPPLRRLIELIVQRGATLEVQGRFFRLLAPAHKAPDPPHWAVVYRFHELDPNTVIRGLVPYRDVAVPLTEDNGSDSVR